MLGFLLFLPTIAFVPHWFFVVCPVVVVYRQRIRISNFFDKLSKGAPIMVSWQLLAVVAFVLLCLINWFSHYDANDSMRHYSPYFLLIILTYAISKSVTRQDLLVLVGLICVESLVVVAEYVAGVSTFFTGLSHYQVFDDDGLLYYTRPLGLSTQSSIIAGKLLIAFIILIWVKARGLLAQIAFVLLGFGVLFTFNRTVMVTLFLFACLYAWYFAINLKWKYYHLVLFGLGVVFLASGLTFLLLEYGETIVMQFSRNRGEIEIASRPILWQGFIAFIQDHLWLGNGSHKIFYTGMHAHNSYLQIVATNGILLAVVWIGIVVAGISNRNYVIILPLLAYSMTQYGLFWGISLMDLLLFVALFRSREELLPKQARQNAATDLQLDIA